MRVDGQVIPVGDCAGVFLVPAQQVTVQVGQQIDVRMTEEPAGRSGNQLVPVFPLPRSSRPVVLADGTVSQDRASGTYRAIRPGHAALTTRAWCLVGSGEIRGSCPVLDVTVVPVTAAAAALALVGYPQLLQGHGLIAPGQIVHQDDDVAPAGVSSPLVALAEGMIRV